MQAIEAIPLFRTRPVIASGGAAKTAAATTFAIDFDPAPVADPTDPAPVTDFADGAEALPENCHRRFVALAGKNDAAILEAAHFCCQSCGWSKWTYPVTIITVTGGYNVLCEKCAARHG